MEDGGFGSGSHRLRSMEDGGFGSGRHRLRV